MNKIILSMAIVGVFGCTKAQDAKQKKTCESHVKGKSAKKEPTHKYGGWYCPDNLYGFPAVDIANWDEVPVIEDRLPTKEEVKTEASLIHIDIEKYPNAKPLNIGLPKLATYYTQNSQKDEPIIIIQAVEVEGDSIVGFRFINGGNGSAKINEVKFISENELSNMENGQFVTYEITINTDDEKVWQVMTNSSYFPELQSIFDKNNTLKSEWSTNSNINFNYASNLESTGKFAQKLYGCYYIQNDYLIDGYSFVDKFLLREGDDEKTTTLKITCGPYKNDYEMQKNVVINWAKKVKELSEK